jgi:hypothetical protein
MRQICCLDLAQTVVGRIRDFSLAHFGALAAGCAIVVDITRAYIDHHFVVARSAVDRFDLRQGMETDCGILLDTSEVDFQAASWWAELWKVLVEKGHPAS